MIKKLYKYIAPFVIVSLLLFIFPNTAKAATYDFRALVIAGGGGGGGGGNDGAGVVALVVIKKTQLLL